MKSLALVPKLRMLQNAVVGPRDYYEIEHAKTASNKPYYHVVLCIWKEDWPCRYEWESVSLARAISHVLEAAAKKEANGEL